MTETTLTAELDMAYQGAMEKAREPNHPGSPEDDFEDAMLLKRARDRLAQAEALLRDSWWDCQHIETRDRITAFLSVGGDT